MAEAVNQEPAKEVLIDPVEVATRIAAGGKRVAIAASVLDIIGLAHRAVRLEQLASDTFQLLATFDDLPREAAAALVADRTLITTIAATLEALGYQKETH